MQTIKQYGIFELGFELPAAAGAVLPGAVFTQGESAYSVAAFYNGAGHYHVRFMPQTPGMWHYELNFDSYTAQGDFLCEQGEAHGPVVAQGKQFAYADGARYIPFGTTCYAWTHQTQELQAQTLQSLQAAPFNKIRMCVFPKSMPYNNNEPPLFPFEKNADGSWNVERPLPAFWEHLDHQLASLNKLGIEADLILFHPYDRWGLATLTQAQCLQYLRYCMARLGAFKNIWWSLANEYDLVPARIQADWDAFGALLAAEDPYHHLISIHHCFVIYPKRDWMTHCSVQTNELDRISIWSQDYDLPVIIDECGYEGTIEFNWGNLSAFEMVHRFWVAVTRGAYCTHGETFYREDEVLWWAKGGPLHGESPARIRFLKALLYSLPTVPQTGKSLFSADPNQSAKAKEELEKHGHVIKMLMQLPQDEFRLRMAGMVPAMVGGPDYRLYYRGHACAEITDLALPENGSYSVEAIDVWEMTRTPVLQNANGIVRLHLPPKEGIALLVTRQSGDALM